MSSRWRPPTPAREAAAAAVLASAARERAAAVRVRVHGHFAVDDDETDSKAKPAPADAPEPTCKAQSPSSPSISSEEAQSQELEALLSELWAAIVNGTAKSASFVSAVDFEHYSAFHLALFRALRTKWTRDEAVSLAQADWLSDSLVNLALWWRARRTATRWSRRRGARGAATSSPRSSRASGAGTRPPAASPSRPTGGPVGCCVRAALRLRKRMRAAAAASDGSDGEASDSSSASSSASSSSASELELSWSEAAARAILSSLERPDMKVEEGQRRLWDRTHLRRHALANRLRGRLQAGAVTLLDF
eukprot:tig00001177_g7378.t1